MKVLISAFVCEPLAGSEPEVGWRWAFEMSRYADVVVVTQRKNRGRIERYLADHPEEAGRVEFRYHAPGLGLERLRKRLRLGYFMLWQWTLRATVKRWVAEDAALGLIHHVTFASFRYPCFLGGLGIPVVWGPVGGADEAPEGLLAYRGRWQARLKERVRNGLTGASRLLLPWLDPTDGGRHGMILASTPSMAGLFEGEGLCCETFPTIGMTDEEWRQAEPPAGGRAPGPPRFLYVGRLHFLKGIHLLLEAVAGLRERDFELTLVGGGPEDRWLRGLAAELGVAERVSFMGPVPRDELPEWYRRHDAIISPSLYESGGLATLEAMNHGLPAIVLDVGGHQLSVTGDCGIRVDPHGPGGEVVARLRMALRTYLDQPELMVRHGQAARRRVAEHYLWSRKAEWMIQVYQRGTGGSDRRKRNMSVVRDEVEAYLRGRCVVDGKSGLVMLRHGVIGVERSPTSDWDVHACDPCEEDAFEQCFGAPWVRVVRRFVTQRFYQWGQVDFLHRFEFQGVPYLKLASLRKRLQHGDDGVTRPCLAHDAWIAWMSGVLWGGSFRDRFRPLLAAAWQDEPAELRRCAGEAFGRAWGEQLMAWLRAGMPEQAAAHAGQLRAALVRRAMIFAPGLTLAGRAKHWWAEFKNHLKPPFPWIAILGPDGSGKSSVIAGLDARLREIRTGMRMTHWRPHTFSGKAVRGGPIIVTDPHGKPPRGALASLAKLILIGVDWWIGFFAHARHARATRAVWVSDRYYDDLLVDPRRYRYGGPLAWARWIFRCLPRPDRVIVLTGEAEQIHARKQEVTLDELKRQLGAYRDLATRLGPRAVAVDACQPPEQVIEDVWKIVVGANTGRRKH